MANPSLPVVSPPILPVPSIAADSQYQIVFDRDLGAWRVTPIVGGSPVSALNPLPVSATINVGDIEIGAVEIKDHDSETRLDIEPLHDYNVMLTYDGIEYQKVKIHVYDEQSIAPGSTVTIVTRTTAAGKLFVATGMAVGGNDQAEFNLFVDGNKKMKHRNSGSHRTETIKFPESYDVPVGKAAFIEAKNVGIKTTMFEVTLFGYEVNVP